jgi:hypothetical protein
MSVVSAAWGGSQATPAGTEFVAFRFDDARAIATVKVADLPDAGQIRQGLSAEPLARSLAVEGREARAGYRAASLL